MNADVYVDFAPSGVLPRVHAATVADSDAATAFIAASGLPTADLSTSSPYLWIARTGQVVSGTVGLEVHGDAGLLRSLAVAPASRGRGLGTLLVDRVEQEARGLGLAELVLLTETADDFFSALGYRVVARESVPEAIRRSAEFRALCPASATCMRKALS